MNALLQQHSTFFPHHHNTPRRSSPISPTHLSPGMAARKRKADDDLDPRSYDEDMSVSPLASPSIAARHLARPSKKVRNNEVTGRPLALSRLLETLDADSLRGLLQTICDRHPQIGQEVVTSAPRPSVSSALGVLEQYQERLRQAFPFGNNTGDYAYNRVRVQLSQLIEAITDFVPHYLPPNESQITISLEFLDGVTNIVHQLPNWESVSHRHHKDNAYDEISQAWALVISEASKRGGGIQLHNGEWDQKLQKHNEQSGGRMQTAVNALGSNLGWIGAGGSNNISTSTPSNDPNSIRNQLFSGTYGMNPVRVGPW